jgi:hypothetical protein
MSMKTTRTRKVSRSKPKISDAATTRSFKALMKKNAGKHRFEGLDEGTLLPSIPRKSAKKRSTT